MAKAHFNRLKVLVVEDDNSIRNILNDLLQLEKHKVVLAADGKSALKHLQSQTFDIMITDLGLPDLTGCDLARAARRFQEQIGIISISSWQGKETEKMAVESGIDIAIWKPFRFDQIVESIGEIAGRASRNKIPTKS